MLFVIHYALFELVIKQRTNKAKLVQCWQKLLANAQNEEEEEEAEEQSAALCEKSASNFQFGHGKTAKLTLSLAISLYPYLYLMMEILNPQWWISNLVSDSSAQFANQNYKTTLQEGSSNENITGSHTAKLSPHRKRWHMGEKERDRKRGEAGRDRRCALLG